MVNGAYGNQCRINGISFNNSCFEIRQSLIVTVSILNDVREKLWEAVHVRKNIILSIRGKGAPNIKR